MLAAEFEAGETSRPQRVLQCFSSEVCSRRKRRAFAV